MLYPYQSVEVKNRSDASTDSVAGNFISSVKEATVLKYKAPSIPLPTHNAKHHSLSIIDSKPLHKSKSEVISKSKVTHADSGNSRTPLKASKTDVNLKPLSTPSISDMTLIPCTPCSGGGDDGGLPGTPSALTPRNSTTRGSKRARRKARNARLALLGEPDGLAGDASSPAKRGVPDGAECTLRGAPISKSGGDLEDLEDQYLTIKSAVTNMENDVDCDTLRDMKNSSLFGDEIASLSTTNHNEIIQSAYDMIKKESSILGMSPSENLSRRLDKELKIRRRRSGEGRVIRSPSERKIGTIRRRSKELELKQTRTSQSFCEDPSVTHCATPKFKSALFKSPLTQSLKRGRPNSVRCGLPVIVRPQSPLNRTTNATALPVFDLGTDINHPRTMSHAESMSSEGSFHSTTSSLNCLSSLGSSLESDATHFMPSMLPGVDTACFTPSLECDNENWVTAEDFLEQVGNGNDIIALSGLGDPNAKQKDGNRPSIAALKKQRKVTANVQLFNQLNTTTVGSTTTTTTTIVCGTPNQQRRQSRLYAATTTTPSYSCAVPRPVASERRVATQRPLQLRPQQRATLTPRQLSRAANMHSARYGRPDARPKIAIVSPLRENWAANGTATPCRRPATPSDGVFKTPGPPPLTPLYTRQSKTMKIAGLNLKSPEKNFPTDMIL